MSECVSERIGEWESERMGVKVRARVCAGEIGIRIVIERF